jgi:hypothetical protein
MKKLLNIFLFSALSAFGQSYTMQTEYSCGPDAVAFSADIPRPVVYNAFGWKDRNNPLDNLHDTPAHHFIALRNLNIQYKKTSCTEILGGKGINGKTIILLHNKIHPFIVQHWAVLFGVDNTFVFLHYGDGKIHQVTRASFVQLYTKGWPNCAYTIFTSEQSALKWWERLGWNILKNF